jgi:hypothetical protein
MRRKIRRQIPRTVSPSTHLPCHAQMGFCFEGSPIYLPEWCAEDLFRPSTPKSSIISPLASYNKISKKCKNLYGHTILVCSHEKYSIDSDKVVVHTLTTAHPTMTNVTMSDMLPHVICVQQLSPNLL